MQMLDSIASCCTDRKQSMRNDGSESSCCKIPQAVDYLVVGAGAFGMAFVDTLLHEGRPTPRVLLVDSQDRPGGHWLTSYEFVQLHAPAFLYGVNSEDLVVGKGYVGGCRAEEPAYIRDHSYFAQRVGRERLEEYYSLVLDSWRRKFRENICFAGGWELDEPSHSGHDVQIHCIRCTSTKATRDIIVRKRLVLANYCMPETPFQTHNQKKKLPFEIDPKAHKLLVPINEIFDATPRNKDVQHEYRAKSLCTHAVAGRQYLLLGGGKTGLDAVVYLQRFLNVAAERIFWIIPNDSYFVNRNYQKSSRKNLSMVTAMAKNPFLNNRGSVLALQEMLMAVGLSEDLKRLDEELNEGFNDKGKIDKLLEERRQLFAQAGSKWFEQNSSCDPNDEENLFKHMSPKVLPTKFRVGFTDGEEIRFAQKIDEIGNVYRGSRVERIHFDEPQRQLVVSFCDGRKALSLPIPVEDSSKESLDNSVLHRSLTIVNCTSSVLRPVFDRSGANAKPVFEGGLIRLQYLMLPPPCLSASIIAKIETMTTVSTDDEKNLLVPLSATEQDLGEFRLADGLCMNKTTFSENVTDLLLPHSFLWNAPSRWKADPRLRTFLEGSRLSTLHWGDTSSRCMAWVIPSWSMYRRWEWLLRYL